MNKKLCQIHHLYFKTRECPMCLEERIKKLEDKFLGSKSVNYKKEKNMK